MDNWQELNIRIQMEIAITEREGMIAENMHREHLGQSMAYTEDSFRIVCSIFTELLEILRSGR